MEMVQTGMILLLYRDILFIITLCYTYCVVQYYNDTI